MGSPDAIEIFVEKERRILYGIKDGRTIDMTSPESIRKWVMNIPILTLTHNLIITQ